MLRGWRLRMRYEADVSMPCRASCIITSRNTHHIDTTVTRNSNDAVERSHINAHNRHVCSSLRGIRLLGKGYQKGREKKEVRVKSSDGGQQRKCLYKLDQRWCGWR